MTTFTFTTETSHKLLQDLNNGYGRFLELRMLGQ